MSRLKTVNLTFSYFLSDFHFIFNLFLYFLFIELRIRVGVTIGHTVTSVTSDNMVTVIITGHEI